MQTNQEITENRVEMERDEDFGLGTYEDMLMAVKHITSMIIPNVAVEVTGGENQKRLLVEFHFQSPDNIGLFLGRKLANLKMLQRFVRAQQLYPHDRYIKMVINKGNGDTQSFMDTNVAKLRRKEQ
jgi:hypothetical protein